MFRHRPSCPLEGLVSRTLGQRYGKQTPVTDLERCPQKSSPRESSADASKIRSELVERIRRAIAEGRYETAEKWEAALEVLFQRLRDV
jgi:hypothetical protein